MKLKIVFFLAFITIFNVFSSEYPETISKDAQISIINIDYNSYFKSIFSKSCLRIYDKPTGFDELIDFTYFENFDDELFPLKFYFSHKKKAQIISISFSSALQKEKNTSISEMVLNLSYGEILYIFDFLKQLHNSMPVYFYDYDIQKNNSFTHISKILNDCFRSNKELTTERSFSKDFRKLIPVYKNTINNVPVLSYDFNSEEIEQRSYKIQLPKISFIKLIPLLILDLLVVLYSAYQTIVIYKPAFYISSLLKLFQCIDFIIFFLSGLAGSIIILQDYFSSQELFRNNFEFLYLCPVNVLIAFDIYFPILNESFKKIFWPLSAAFIILYFPIFILIQRELPLIKLLTAVPLLFRAVHYVFISYFSKVKEITQPSETKKAEMVSQISLSNK